MDAEQYRAQALMMIALAHATDDPAVRAELLSLAERFTTLAGYASRFGADYGTYFQSNDRPDVDKAN